MVYRIAADFLVLFHFAFILFVVLGGFAVLRRPWLAWLHLPCAGWGMLVEFTGWICPLTPWEQDLRLKAGKEAYPGDFIGHYLTALIYPEGLTPWIQMALGAIVLVLNLAVYSCLVFRLRSKRRAALQSPKES